MLKISCGYFALVVVIIVIIFLNDAKTLKFMAEDINYNFQMCWKNIDTGTNLYVI